MSALREAAQQALEACEQRLPFVGQATIIKELNALRAALAQEQAEPEGSVCARCGALAFDPVVPQQAEPLNLSDRAVQRRLAAQWGYVQQAEPVQEPVAVVRWDDIGHISWRALVMLPDGTQLYTAPPRRTMVPLTDEEILAAVGWERAEMYIKLTPNFPVNEAKKETLKNARAVEKASWEKNHG